MSIVAILPQNDYSEELKAVLQPLLPEDALWRDPADGLEGLRGRKLLFAVALDRGGCNLSYYRMLSVLRLGDGLLEGCLAVVVVTEIGRAHV